jgi:TRAP-type mannitol/chloroaromatic compound transport system permease small subunit
MIMKSILSIIDKSSGGLGILAAWIVLPLIFATVYEVLSRYLFNAPTIWAYEVGYMATGANFLLGTAFALREKSHIRIDVAYMHFRPRTKALVDVLGYTFLMLPFGYWLSYRLGVYAFDAYLSGDHSGESAWNPIIWPYRTVFFVGIFMLTLQCTAEWVRALKAFFAANNQDEPVDHG